MRNILFYLALLVCNCTLGQQVSPLDNMPVIPYPSYGSSTLAPVEKRDVKYISYLQASVRVRDGGTCGSATICYYDETEKTAYLISCGHLFNGTETPGNCKETCFVEVFYKNDVKLKAPQRFPATVIGHDRKEDISFLKFKPDWDIENFFPIAPVNYPIRYGDVLESTGCDHAEEVAAYTVKVIQGEGERNLNSEYNSPRPGRSGGGLLSPDGYYLAIVWGTSFTDGSGIGYYVPLNRIHAYASKFPQTAWLLSVDKVSLIQSIPIVDAKSRSVNFPKRFIPKP